jgi:predicted RNase H-like HicB family nuclease
MRHYIALIHKDADSDYGVSFPDLPGVVTAGSDLGEARKMAFEALAFHLAGLAEDGEAVPQPSLISVKLVLMKSRLSSVKNASTILMRSENSERASSTWRLFRRSNGRATLDLSRVRHS